MTCTSPVRRELCHEFFAPMCQFFTQARQKTLRIVLQSGVEIRLPNCINGDVNASAVPYDRDGAILFQLNAKDEVGCRSE